MNLSADPNVLMNFPDPLLSLGRDGSILWFNKQLSNLIPKAQQGLFLSDVVRFAEQDLSSLIALGLSSSEILPFRVNLAPTSGSHASGELWRAVTGGSPHVMLRFKNREADASRFRVLSETIEDLNREIGRRRQIESSLREAVENLDQAIRVKDRILNEVSHDLRTPLNAIIGFSEAMNMGVGGELNSKQREYSDMIRSSGGILLDLVNRILSAVSEVDQVADTQETLTDLFDCLERCVLVVEAARKEKSITILIPDRDKVPAIRVEQAVIISILTNLLENAVKFSPLDGEVSVFCEKMVDESLLLHIEDQGPGIRSEDLEWITTPFYRSGSAHVADAESYGLGLSIVENKLTSFGGTVVFSNREPIGTRVQIGIPYHLVDWSNARKYSDFD